jgi:hypothetical protein
MKFAVLVLTLVSGLTSAYASSIIRPAYSLACIDLQGGAYSVSLAGPVSPLICENDHCAAKNGTTLESATSTGTKEDMMTSEVTGLLELLRPIVSGINISGDPISERGPSLYRFNPTVVLCSAPIRDDLFLKGKVRRNLGEFLIDGGPQ